MKKCTFKEITQTSSDCSAIVKSETSLSLTLRECTFENVVCAKREGEVMEMQSGSVVMDDTSFTHTLTPLDSHHHSEQTVRMNEGESVERHCSWYQSAIHVESVSARMEKCTFSNMNGGGVSVRDESILVVRDVTFTLSGDNTSS